MPNRGGNDSQSADFQDPFDPLGVQDEWRTFVAQFQNLSTVKVVQPQEQRQVAAPGPSLNDPQLEPSTAFECEGRERSVTPIQDSPMLVGIQTLRFVAGDDDDAFPPAVRLKLLPVLQHQVFGTRGKFPDYWTLFDPENIVYGLKVWQIDGTVWYIKTKRRFQHHSQAETGNYGSIYTGYSYDARIQKAGSERQDYALLCFLIDRGEEDLWEVLMGNTPPAPGRRFLEFPTAK